MVKVTLERPWLGGTLLLGLGHEDPIKNLNYDPKRPESGPPYHPGKPVLWGPLDSSDAQKNYCFMPETAAKTLFGDWDAPQNTPAGGIAGWTKGDEKAQVTRRWGDYKKPPSDGTMNPPQANVGPPDVPFVKVEKVNSQMRVEGDWVYRPREYFGFDSQQYADIRDFGGKSDSSDRESMKREIMREVFAEMQAEKVTANRGKTQS